MASSNPCARKTLTVILAAGWSWQEADRHGRSFAWAGPLVRGNLAEILQRGASLQQPDALPPETAPVKKPMP